MSYTSGYFKIKLKINPLGFGGHKFYTKEENINSIWGQIWTGDYSNEKNPFGKNKLPVVHSILLNYPKNNIFEPENTYITNTFIRSYENLDKNFNIGSKFEIIIGKKYNDKNWATGEILEILDEDTNKN